ncbi:MAG: SAM-dependent methyltransferase [Betaproteobacteria bacterium]|jgi:SAM-dependent MidA family methyltransferase
MTEAHSLTTAMLVRVHKAILAAQGWLPFDQFMALALYEPGLGYYANQQPKFGNMPQSGSDFVTAPELSPLFGAALAQQVAEALKATGTDEVWEFGAGSGALAHQLLSELKRLGCEVKRYNIMDVSSTLKARQQSLLAEFGDQVKWLNEWPESLQGVVVGNEVLDAMPVKLLHRIEGKWHERGVVVVSQSGSSDGLAWEERPTLLRPPLEPVGEHDYLTEIQPQGEAFVASLAERLLASEKGGAAFFLDYGFPEAEFFHPERHMGTLMCHQAHKADVNPLEAVGLKDITAHVNFTGMALAGQDAGLQVLGYTSQARFLLNLGLAERMAESGLAQRAQAIKLINEHEMGELFKVLGFSTHAHWQAQGFAVGDRSHKL